MAQPSRWTEDETKRAPYLYFQLPFGQLHQRNAEIIALAKALGRTPSSIAMKLANFASMDPKIVESGRKGLAGATSLDRKVWGEFHADWTKLVLEAASSEILLTTDAENKGLREPSQDFHFEPPGGASTKRAEINQRIGQSFFRRAVLANFDNVCWVTGIAEPRLLVASHITPWGADIVNRHNPRNGLSLSATFDRAFDANLMTVTPDLKVRLSGQLVRSSNPQTRAFFSRYDGRALRSPTHLTPDPMLLESHSARFLA